MDQGWSGLEVYYEDYLSGSEGSCFIPLMPGVVRFPMILTVIYNPGMVLIFT
jgi:hypothetical protein